ncbi:hypothetical protein BDZ97DRAFT_1700000 [Flammula alnicola]|nr:hypothetical protein BDZ97DRAFT_1700000 [Flammula alnicola]
MSPYPRYSACTPSSKNVIGEPHVRARFAPFADDQDFDLEGYLIHFEDFMWQNDFPDPDLEMIQIEVARRLHFKHNFSFDEIDHLDILTFRLRETNSKGLIWNSAQRDYAWWPGSQTNELQHLRTNWVDPDLDLYENVTKDLTSFCPNLNCLHTSCGIHKVINPVFPPKPTLTADMVKSAGGTPCKKNCYKSIEPDNMNTTNNHWDKADSSLFKSVMKLAPDASPCDLAVICRKSCVEVLISTILMYIERLNFFKDEDIATGDREDSRVSLKKILFLEDTEDVLITAVDPCYHLGACNQFSDCPCYHNRQRCQRSCRCSKKCEIRYKGCKCGHRGNKSTPCCVDPRSCECRRLNRECDPELCRGCDARGAHEAKCQNTDLQKGRFVKIRIQESPFGLGAFATSDIRKGSYIGEYTGEMTADNIESYLGPMQKHTGLNYTFDLTKDNIKANAPGVLLDSWDIGNEMRYLNHSTEPNCKASPLHVNGVHRIVICALTDIRPNTELTLDYGPNYWRDH